MSDSPNIQKQKTRILILVDRMGAGGKERQIIELIKGIKRNKRYKTYLVALNRGGDREVEAKEWADSFLSLPRNNRFNLFTAYRALLTLIKRENVQLIHTFGSSICDVLGVFAAKQGRIPVIHGGIRSAPSRLTFYHYISKWSALLADSIIANSYAGLQAYGLTNHPHSLVIYNGIDLKRFESVDSSLKERATLCMVANFSKMKDHATIIRALPIIQKTFPNASLCLVGKDAGTLAASRALVDNLDLSNSVRLVTNTIYPEPYINGSQICILTTFTEGFSNSILEYMALTKPVVATAGSGNEELVVPGKTGLLVPRSSPELLANQVVMLLSNPEFAYALGKAARQLVIDKFSLDIMVSNFEDVYEGLLAK